MKIVYVYPQFAHLAGTERVLIDKMNYLSKLHGVDVYMVTHEQGSHPVAYQLYPSVIHVDLGICFYTLYKNGLIRRILKRYSLMRLLRSRFNHLMAEIDPDVVISVTYHAYLISIIANCPGRFARLLESHIDKNFLHCNDPLNQANWRKMLRSILVMNTINEEISKFDCLVALHQKDADVWKKYLKTRIITNVVHLNDKDKYCNLDSKHIIFVGRYTYQKGVSELFSIWEIVYNNHPDWHLDLYGDGDDNEMPYTSEKRERMNIHVHKANSDIFSCYLESSIFVLTSVYEPFGLVMPEAMSCGLPVVAFDCPSGPASIITDGVDGFLVEDRNICAFADRLCQLIESPQLREIMGKAAIKSSQRYSAERIMPQWIDLFNELITIHRR